MNLFWIVFFCVICGAFTTSVFLLILAANDEPYNQRRENSEQEQYLHEWRKSHP